jgi:hypothetical protein
MRPRLPTSKKSTEFPPDYVKMIKDLINKNFKALSKEYTVHAAGWIYKEEIVTQIGFRTKGGIAQTNFESSIEYSLKPNNIMDQIYASIDALGAMIQQYYEAQGDIEMPKDWYEFDFENKKIYLRMTSENTELEAQANEILQKGGGPVPDVDIIEAEEVEERHDSDKGKSKKGKGGLH